MSRPFHLPCHSHLDSISEEQRRTGHLALLAYARRAGVKRAGRVFVKKTENYLKDGWHNLNFF
jgi:hypothetical protein